jgi:hypothetical protein
MMKKLWGDNFFDPATKKWTSKATDSKTCIRGFVQFCYNPIKQVGGQLRNPTVSLQSIAMSVLLGLQWWVCSGWCLTGQWPAMVAFVPSSWQPTLRVCAFSTAAAGLCLVC